MKINTQIFMKIILFFNVIILISFILFGCKRDGEIAIEKAIKNKPIDKTRNVIKKFPNEDKINDKVDKAVKIESKKTTSSEADLAKLKRKLQKLKSRKKIVEANKPKELPKFATWGDVKEYFGGYDDLFIKTYDLPAYVLPLNRYIELLQIKYQIPPNVNSIPDADTRKITASELSNIKKYALDLKQAKNCQTIDCNEIGKIRSKVHRAIDDCYDCFCDYLLNSKKFESLVKYYKGTVNWRCIDDDEGE